MYQAWLIWFVAAAFYFYEFVLRVTPSLIVPELMQGFGLDALGVGSMSAFYFYSYGLLQLPVGIIADRYGVRVSMGIACLVCAISAVIFSVATTDGLLKLARLLMGGGSAFAYVSTLFLIKFYFQKSQFGLMAGLTNAVGVLGAICAEKPLVFVIDTFGWRHAVILLGLWGVILVLGLLAVIKDPPVERVSTQVTVRQVCAYVWNNTWILILAMIVGLTHFTLVSFGAMWGVSYIEEAYQLSLSAAAGTVSIFYIGALLGGGLLGYMSDKTHRLWVIAGSTLLGAGTSLYMLQSELPVSVMHLVLLTIGFCSAGFGVGYAYAFDHVKQAYAGAVTGLMNTVLIVFSAISMPLVGYLLDIGRVKNHYTMTDYEYALLPIPISFAIAALLTLLLIVKHRENNGPS